MSSYLFRYLQNPGIKAPLGYSLKEVDKRIELNAILEIRNEDITNNFKMMYDKGEKVFLGYINGKCVFHSAVFYTGNEKKRIAYYDIPARTYWIHYCFTSEHHRGKGIYSYSLNQISDMLKSDNSNVIIDTNSSNIASQKGIIKAGFELYDKVHCLNLKYIKIVMTKSGKFWTYR